MQAVASEGGRRLPGARGAPTLVWLALSLALGVLALRVPPVLDGDGGEYALMTESLYRHGSAALGEGDLESMRRLAGPRGLWSREAAVTSGYFAGADGGRYAWHFWGYSLLAVPARALLAVLGGDPLAALPLTNALCLAALAGAVLFAAASPPALRGAFLALVLLSPVLPFLRWTHPEPFVFAFTAMALVLNQRAPLTAVALAAVASMQAPPLVLLVALLWGRLAAPALRARAVGRLAAASAAALPAALAPGFYLLLFATPSLAARQSFMQPSALSIRRALDLAFDLNLGLLPHTPGVLVLAAAAGVAGVLRRRWWTLDLQLLAVAAGIGFASTLNENWNNATSGPSRYGLWLLPLLLHSAATFAARLPPRMDVAALAGAVVLQAAPLLARGGPLAPTDYLQHSAAARAVLDRWPAAYSPTHEIFVERTLGSEERSGPPPFVYRSQGGCRKALLRRRFAESLESQCGPIPAGQRGRFFPRPADAEARNEWTYVSW